MHFPHPPADGASQQQQVLPSGERSRLTVVRIDRTDEATAGDPYPSVFPLNTVSDGAFLSPISRVIVVVGSSFGEAFLFFFFSSFFCPPRG